MKSKNYEPIKDLILFQSEWEEIMQIIDKSTHKNATSRKYKLQCMINMAKLNHEWI